MRSDLEKQFATEHDSLTAAQHTLKEKAEKLASNKAVMTTTDYTAEKTALQKEQHELQTKQTAFQKKAESRRSTKPTEQILKPVNKRSLATLSSPPTCRPNPMVTADLSIR